MDKGHTLDQIEIGREVRLDFEVTEERIRQFADATGDRNPIHLDEDYARTTPFKTRIAHGMLSAGFISAVLGTTFPGVGTVYLNQTIRFLKPVFIGDVITARITALEKWPDKNRLRLETVCLNQNGDTVLFGEALVMPPA